MSITPTLNEKLQSAESRYRFIFAHSEAQKCKIDKLNARINNLLSTIEEIRNATKVYAIKRKCSDAIMADILLETNPMFEPVPFNTLTEEEMEQKPSVGRIVHYQAYNEKGECAYAAIVTRVNEDETIDLATFGSNSLYFQPKVKYSAEPKPGCWNWPPKV